MTTADSPRTGRRWWKTLLWVLFGFVLVALLVITLFFRYSVRRAFPDIDGTVTVAGLDGDVEIIRDSMGVPHIYADTTRDLFMAQGYVHAQDRFFQMDFWRHLSSGRLSEMFGSTQVETDTYLRTMGWARLAEAQYAAETDEVRWLLDSYSAGVNAYLATRSPSDLAFEYSILELLNHDYTPAEWHGSESLAWGKVMSFELGGNMHTEVERAMALTTLPAERVAQLYPLYPGDRHPYIVPGDGASTTAAEASLTSTEDIRGALEGTVDALEALFSVTGGGPDSNVGSNSWAVRGSLTDTGDPMLMNDPHLGSLMPSIWYQVGLHCRTVSADCPFDVAGFSFAGVPGVIIGHNADIAWGFTNIGPDVQDLFIERINPDNPHQYEVNGEWVDMDVRVEIIEVAGGDPVEIEVRTTRHGPIVSEILPYVDATSSSWKGFEGFDGSGVAAPANHALALKWTGLEAVRSIAGPIMAINTASNFEEFQAGALLFSDPAQNLLYADTRGNIGYQMPGNIPIRASGDGSIPVPGWTDEYEWIGYIPQDELPWMYNPESGWIVTANNAVIDDSFDYFITNDWSRGYRARRIVDLLTSNPGIGMSDHATIQFDSYDLNAEFALPYLLEATGSTSLDDQELEARDILATWDFQEFAGSTGAAIWNVTWKQLLEQTFHDELDEFLWPRGGQRWFEVVRNLLDQPTDPYWDDVTTSAVETRDDILRASFVAAVDELDDTLGGSVEDWTWGAIHSITLTNPTLGESGIGLIEDRFNRGPFAASGSESVPNAMGWDAPYSYEVDWIPSMRMLVDLGDLQNSRAILSTGQSGHTDHPHYDDMAPLWLAGESAPMMWNRSAIEADAEGTLVLRPPG